MDINVSVLESDKPAIIKNWMQAGDSMDISYNNKIYKLILREVNYIAQNVVVTVAPANK